MLKKFNRFPQVLTGNQTGLTGCNRYVESKAKEANNFTSFSN